MPPPIHPSLQGRCQLKRTVLLVGEGPMEWAFLQHVVNLFVVRDGPIAAKAENGHGGDPSVVIHQVRKLLSQRAYDRCLVLMDTDRPWPPSLPGKLGNSRMTYVKAEPVLEGMLLRIVEHPGITIRTSVAECKRVLYRDYLDEKRRTDVRSYNRSFSRPVLEKGRLSCAEFDSIMNAIESR